MFMGEYSHTIDTKGRLIIPAKIREQLGETCIVTKGLDNSLAIYTQEAWSAIAEKLQSLPSNKSNVRAYKRFLFGSASELDFDKQGRVLVPSPLRKYAELKKSAVIVGAGDHVEIWSKEHWNTYTDEVGDSMEALAENLDLDGIML